METNENKEMVVEANAEKKKEPSEKEVEKIDGRTIRLVTKPYVFPGESSPRSEEILIRAIDAKTYEKNYRGIDPGKTEVRKVKRVTLNKLFTMDGVHFQNVTEYFDYLLKNRGYSVMAENISK